MPDMKYRYPASMIPMFWAIIDAKTSKQIPGNVVKGGIDPTAKNFRRGFSAQLEDGNGVVVANLWAETLEGLDKKIGEHLAKVPV
jgi:hypothetical protein